MPNLRSPLVALAIIVATGSPALAQVSGSPGGLSGGLGGVTGAVGGAVGGIGGAAGGSVGGAVGSLAGPGGMLGGVGSTIGGVGSSVGSVVGSGTQMVGGRLVNTTSNLSRQVRLRELQRRIAPDLGRLNTAEWVDELPPETLLQLRKLRLAELVKQSGGKLEMDALGNPAVRGRLIAIDPTKTAIKAAVRAGFTVTADTRDATLNVHSVTFNVPRGMATANAIMLLRRAQPTMIIDVDHVFEPAGGALAATSIALANSVAVASTRAPLIGMIDGGVAESPALAAASIDQKGFAGDAQATGHGTAVASLIVGSDGKFHGAAPGVSLLVGDVYGGDPAAGSATVIVRALSWITAQRPSVINISLVGPRNALVERAVAAIQARGIKIVASVGNDGPAAPPLYPASHNGVIAVTGVDGTSRALAEAGRASHLDYAAPGADLAAALPGKGYGIVRGTSFAAPFVAARLALTGSTAKLDSEVAKGLGRIGRGVICKSCRVLPKQVGAK
jgi:hypothetical protein